MNLLSRVWRWFSWKNVDLLLTALLSGFAGVLLNRIVADILAALEMMSQSRPQYPPGMFGDESVAVARIFAALAVIFVCYQATHLQVRSKKGGVEGAVCAFGQKSLHMENSGQINFAKRALEGFWLRLAYMCKTVEVVTVPVLAIFALMIIGALIKPSQFLYFADFMSCFIAVVFSFSLRDTPGLGMVWNVDSMGEANSTGRGSGEKVGIWEFTVEFFCGSFILLATFSILLFCMW